MPSSFSSSQVLPPWPFHTKLVLALTVPHGSDWAPCLALSSLQAVLPPHGSQSDLLAHDTPLAEPLLGPLKAPGSGSQPEVCSIIFGAAFYNPVHLPLLLHCMTYSSRLTHVLPPLLLPPAQLTPICPFLKTQTSSPSTTTPVSLLMFFHSTLL